MGVIKLAPKIKFSAGTEISKSKKKPTEVQKGFIKDTAEDQSDLSLWITLSRAYQEIEKNEDALRCAKQASKCDLNNFEARLLMAAILFDLKEYSEAEQQLRWCVSRRPDHSQSQKLLKTVVKARIAGHQSPNGTATR